MDGRTLAPGTIFTLVCDNIRPSTQRGVGWGGVGMMTFLELAHMVGATQHHVSCTGTHGRCYATSCFLHLHTWSVLRNIMFNCMSAIASGHLRSVGWGGVGWGGVKFLHIERKITSVVHSHPPSHYIRKHASG